MRFPNVTAIRPRPRTTMEFFVAFEGMFEKTIWRGAAAGVGLGTTNFKVALTKQDSATMLKVERLGSAKSSLTSVQLSISGLEKYLIDVSTLQCKARIGFLDDIFKVWGIVETALTRESQFFTLIDIYGHYANRGDTVKILTKLVGKNPSALERAIQFFGDSSNCGYLISYASLSERLQIPKKRIPDLIDKLRFLRWDVRNGTTHATITEEGAICTYPFPLLSGKAQFDRKDHQAALA